MKEIIIALISILPGMATLIVGLVTNKKVKKQRMEKDFGAISGLQNKK